MATVISVENLSKSYRLGQIGTGTFTNDLKLWWAKMCGKPNPLLRIGESDHGNRDGETVWALKDVSFAVEQGEVLGIIGRNGAGKSTLLKILSRVTAPTSGRIRVKGRVASLLEVGTGFHPELTGRENIYLNGAILGMNHREIDRKFDEIVDFAEIEKFIDTPVKRYSSGMYVRLAFAVAAHLEPEILVVDEVLAVGDAEFQKKCLGKMGDVANEGRTVLFVSHNMIAVSSLCSRAILLTAGNISVSGDSDQVVNKYLEGQRNQNHGELLNVVERTGTAELKILKWEVEDEVLGNTFKVRSNSSCVFKIQYSTFTPEIKNVDFAIVIKNLMDQRIVTASTEFFRKKIKLAPNGTVSCCFDCLPLMPGVYTVHLWCGRRNETIDLVENAGQFEIIASDIYNSGFLPEKKHGQIAVLHSWRSL